MGVDPGFQALRELVQETTGLALSPEKSSMIQSRLRHRLSALGCASIGDYCDYLVGPNGVHEMQHMISALTTNVTSFFREPHHFDLLSERILPSIEKRLKFGETVRLWSAGCSRGHEPYSLAIHLLERSDIYLNPAFKILATDIDQEVIGVAQTGVYPKEQVDNIAPKILETYFTLCTHGQHQGMYKVEEKVRSLISFRKLNLLSDWPMKSNYAAVFCRNVVIYFNNSTQNTLWPKFHDLLEADGLIFVGHSERINFPGFHIAGPTTYEKTNGSRSPSLER